FPRRAWEPVKETHSLLRPSNYRCKDCRTKGAAIMRVSRRARCMFMGAAGLIVLTAAAGAQQVPPQGAQGAPDRVLPPVNPNGRQFPNQPVFNQPVNHLKELQDL